MEPGVLFEGMILRMMCGDCDVSDSCENGAMGYRQVKKEENI